MRYFNIFILLFCAIPAVAVEPLIFTCERTEKSYTETYELKISPVTKTQKPKVFIDGRDLDRSDEMGRQSIKNIVIDDSSILISIEAHFPPEIFDGMQYGAGSATTLIAIHRASGQLRKVETIKGGILSTTLGDGTRVYQEQCATTKKR